MGVYLKHLSCFRAAEKGNFEAAVKLGIAYLYNEGRKLNSLIQQFVENRLYVLALLPMLVGSVVVHVTSILAVSWLNRGQMMISTSGYSSSCVPCFSTSIAE